MLLTYGSSSELPLLRVQFFTNGTLHMSQEGRSSDEIGLFTVPVSLVDNTNETEQFVLTEGHVSSSKSASFVLVQPDSTAMARAVYNVRLRTSCAYRCIRPQLCITGGKLHASDGVHAYRSSVRLRVSGLRKDRAR